MAIEKTTAKNIARTSANKNSRKEDLKGQTTSALQKLFGVSGGEVAAEGLKLVAPSQITTGVQPRTLFPPEEIRELADSIASVRDKQGGIEGTGILQPLLVRLLNEDEKEDNAVRYFLIAGERRLRAARMLKLSHVPVIVLANSTSVDPATTLAAQIIENLQRRDLVPIEEAKALRQLMNQSALSIRDTATWLGKPKSYVSDRLALLSMGDDIQILVSERSDTLVHARVLDSVKEPDFRSELISATREGASLREIQRQIAERQQTDIRHKNNTGGDKEEIFANGRSKNKASTTPIPLSILSSAADALAQFSVQTKQLGLPETEVERKKMRAALQRISKELGELRRLIGD